MHVPFLDFDGPSDRRLCSRFVHYLVKQKHVSSFCFFELRFFGKRVNSVSRQAFLGQGAGRKHAAHAVAWGTESLEFQL